MTSNKNTKMLFVLIPLVLLVLAQMACLSNDDLLKIKANAESNVIATQVPVVNTLQQGAEKVNKKVESVVVPAAKQQIDAAKSQIDNGTLGQAAQNAKPSGLCPSGKVLGSNGFCK